MLWPAAAWAGLTEQQIGDVALAPPPGARVPADLVFRTLKATASRSAVPSPDRPTLLLPADFTCSGDLRAGAVDRGKRAEPNRT